MPCGYSGCGNDKQALFYYLAKMIFNTAVMPACLANLSSPDFQRLILYNIEIGLLYFDASTINQNPGIGLNHD